MHLDAARDSAFDAFWLFCFASCIAGSAASKNRALVAGGGSKPFRQKGTGRARAGTTRAGQRTGGGVGEVLV